METIEESDFQHICMYCSKLNLLEKHREVFLKLQECLQSSLIDLKRSQDKASSLNTSNEKLEDISENLRKANTQLCVEYEDKLMGKQELLVSLQNQVDELLESDGLKSDHEDLKKQYESLSVKMDNLINKNTILSQEKHDLEKLLREDEDKHSSKPLPSPPEVVSPEDEGYRAKLRADLERKQKLEIEKLKKDFSSKFEVLRKSFAMKVEPLEKKKTRKFKNNKAQQDSKCE